MPKIHADGHTTDAGQDAGPVVPALAEDVPAPAFSGIAGLITATGEAEVIKGEPKSTKRGKQ